MATRKTTKKSKSTKTQGRAKPGRGATTTSKATRVTTAPTASKGKAKATSGAKTAKAATQAKLGETGGGHATAKKRTGILNAAAEILAKAPEPMGCKAIVEQVLESGLWTTMGKTPSATLYAAIIREIAKKGKDARFEKVDRGRFKVRKTA